MDNASNFLTTYCEVKKHSTLPSNFRIVKNKTPIQRLLLRNCHSELDRKTQAGKIELRMMISLNCLSTNHWMKVSLL